MDVDSESSSRTESENDAIEEVPARDTTVVVEDKLRETMIEDFVHLKEEERLARLRVFYRYDEEYYEGEDDRDALA